MSRGRSTEVLAFDLYIDGREVPARGGARFESSDPFTGEVWATVADGGVDDVALAVDAAGRALRGPWRDLGGARRGQLLHRLADVVESRVDELAEIEVRDNGKLRRDALSQVSLLPVWLRYFAGLADKVQGDTIPDAHPDYFVYTRQEPVGVVAAVLPWNAPLILAMYKIAPALAAGCTIVAKPSEFTPASLLALARSFAEAGIPDGVFNVVAGVSRETGAALVAHPGVAHVAFTGSTATGVAISKSAADHVAHVSLELGGKSAQVITENARVDHAVNGVVAGVFAAAGQMCHAGSRVFVHRSRYDEFVVALAERARTIVLGDPLDEGTHVGPLSTPLQYAQVVGMLERAQAAGATVVEGGGPAERGGLFVRPTVLTDVDPAAEIARQEVFGPVVVVAPYDSEDEAVRMANHTDYGLAAGIWSEDVRQVHRLAALLEAGTVWVNCYRVASPAVPFGGTKASGIGRENGIDAVRSFTETKSVWVELSGTSRDPFRMG